MGSSMDQGFVLERFYPFRNVANLAIFLAHSADYFFRISVFAMVFSGSVTDLATSVLEMGGLFRIDKPTWLAIACSVAWVTLPDLFLGKMFHLSLN